MTTHFLDAVRTKYNLPTSNLDEGFTAKLSYKSGADRQLIQDILDQSKSIQEGARPSDKQLMEFNERLDEFYKNT